MKRLKKMAVVLTTAAMMMSMGMTTYAAEITQKGSTASADVTGNYEDTASIIYNVDLKWENMEFTYYKNGIWNAATHEYEKVGGWTGKATITATNHSNAEVTLDFWFTKNNTISGNCTAEFTNSTDNKTIRGAYTNVKLNNAEGTEFNAAPNISMSMSMSGDPDQFTTGTTIGTLKVSIK